jgi:hypothetical protein
VRGRGWRIQALAVAVLRGPKAGDSSVTQIRAGSGAEAPSTTASRRPAVGVLARKPLPDRTLRNRCGRTTRASRRGGAPDLAGDRRRSDVACTSLLSRTPPTYKGRVLSLLHRPRPRAIAREKRTVSAMVELYCADHHRQRTALCPSCQGLLDYARQRLDRCPYGEAKPACRECPVHCYQPARREAMREVMRDAGPKMLLHHPWLAVAHLWKEHIRKTPARPAARRKPV